MAYNTNTRLLLKFNESNGATTTVDTSQTPKSVSFTGNGAVSSAVQLFSSNAAVVGDPSDVGYGTPGAIQVDSPNALFSSSETSAKRFDWFFQLGADNEFNSLHGIFEISVDYAAYVFNLSANDGSVYVGGTLPNGTVDQYHTTSSITLGTWHHARVLFYNSQVYFGLDGNHIFTDSLSGDSWPCLAGSSLDYIQFGSAPEAGSQMRGYLDNVQVLEGDTSWTGGSYTVPTAAPDSYGASGDVTGIGANTVASLLSSGTGLVEGATYPAITGDGANVVSCFSVGHGVVSSPINGISSASSSVTSSGFGSIGTGVFTTLLLHGNASDAPAWKDSSLHNQVVTASDVVATTANGMLGDGVLGFNGSHSSLSVPVSNVLFANGDKIIDFFAEVSYKSQAHYLFSVSGWPGHVGISLSLSTGELNYLTLSIDTANYSGSIGAVYPNYDDRHHIRCAFIGQTAYLCVDGAVLGSVATTGANIWPDSQPSLLRVGSDRYGDLALKGSLDEFRIQEGSFTNHGYLGGSYTVPAYEYVPNMLVGSGGSAVDSIVSVGEGVTLQRIGSGSNLVEVSSAGDGFVGVESSGANTVDDVIGSGSGCILPIIFGEGAQLQIEISSVGSGGLVTYGRGASIAETTSHGVGEITPFPRVGFGKPLVISVSAFGTGFVTGLPAIVGTGESTTTVDASGAGRVLLHGSGSNSVSVSSQGGGVSGFIGSGRNVADTSSKGAGSIAVSGYGSNEVSVHSYGYSLREIFGSGRNTASVVSKQINYFDYDNVFSITRTRQVSVLTNTKSVAVMQ